MNNILISLDQRGIGTITIDGKDISKLIHKIELIAEAGKPTDVVVHVRPHQINFNGMSNVAIKSE